MAQKRRAGTKYRRRNWQMPEKIKMPKFQLERIYSDGSHDQPELFELLDLAPNCRMGRRGFMLTSALGAGALALLGGSCLPAPQPGTPQDKNTPKSNETANELVIGNEVKATRIFGLAAHLNTVSALAFSPDGKTLASGSHDKTIKLWSVPDGKLLKTLKEHASVVSGLLFSPDGKTLISACRDGSLKFWPAPFDKSRKTLTKATGEFYSPSLSPDGKILACVMSEKRIELRALPDGKQIADLEGQGEYSLDFAATSFSPDGRLLAATTVRGNRTTIWSVPDGQLLEEWTGSGQSASFSPDGSQLAVRLRRDLSFWNVPSPGASAGMPGWTLHAKVTLPEFLADDSPWSSARTENGWPPPAATTRCFCQPLS